MSKIFGWLPRTIMAMSQGPWGGKGSGPDKENGGSGGSEGPRNPWTQPSGGGGGQGGGPRGPSALDELLRRGREGFGGGFPSSPGGKQLWPIGIALIIVLWLAFTCFHRIGPQERGIVTFVGKYSRTLSPGISVTLPAPIEAVEVVDVEEIRTIDIGSTSSENANLMLTGDQNIIDLAYSVRWNIRSPEKFKFELADPESTIREVSEAAMRSVVATVSLDDALGAGRGEIEQQVQQRAQEILDQYKSGVQIQGVAIKQADPPSEVVDAFKEVSAAQQQADAYLNQAHAYANQLTAKAEGDAAAFDKVYVQYKLAPEVTRRRMYYETMEQVLGNVDKTVVEPKNVIPYLPMAPGKSSTVPEASTSTGGNQ